MLRALSRTGPAPEHRIPSHCLLALMTGLLAAPCLLANDNPVAADPPAQALPPVDVEGRAVRQGVDAVDPQTLTGRLRRIDADAFRARPLELADVLAQQAGLRVRRTGGFASFTSVSIRGASADQVDVTLNGLPLAPSVTGGFNFGAISLRDLATVDIYAGYAPIQLADGGPGGVIDLRTPAGSQPWETSAHASYGSAATVQTGVRTGFETAGVRHGLSLGHAESDNDYPIVNKNRAFDPSDPNRTRTEPRRNAQATRDHGLYTLDMPMDALTGRDSQLSVLAQVARQDQALPDARNSASARTRLAADQTNLQTRLSLRNPAGLPVDVAVRGFSQRNVLTYDDRADQVGLGAQLTESDQRQTGGGVYAETIGGPWQWQTHLQFTRETYAADDALDADIHQSGRRRHWKAAVRVNRTMLNADALASLTLRHQRIDDRFSPEQGRTTGNSESTTNPQFGLRWQPTQALTLHANGGRYLRLPTFFERYGDRGLFIGNNALAPERGRNLNIGAGWQGGHWRLGGEFYASDITDAIVTQFDVLSGIGRAENVAGARIIGIELDAARQWRLTAASQLAVSLGAAIQDTDNQSDGVNAGKQLPGRFETKWFSRTAVQLPAGVEIFHEFTFADGGFYDTLNSRPAPTTRLHALGLRLRRTVAARQIDAGVEVRNATDRQLEDFNAQPRPPRQFFASVEIIFNP